VSGLKPALLSGQPVTAGYVNSLGKSLLKPVESLFSGASEDDLFCDLRKMEKSGQLKRVAQFERVAQIPFLDIFGPKKTGPSPLAMFPSRQLPILERIFGFLSPNRGHNLLVAFVIWFVKIVLVSAGLLVVGGVAAEYFGLGKKGPEPGQQIPNTNVEMMGPVPVPVQRQQVGLKPPRLGSPALEYMPNDARNTWYVPVEGTPRKTLLNWTLRAYPQLSGYDRMITAHPSFGDMVNRMRRGLTPDGSQMAMPIGFTRWVDVVNQFASDVYRVIRGRGRKAAASEVATRIT
jgi:hypothetical protein